MPSKNDYNEAGDNMFSLEIIFATDGCYSSHGVQYTPLQAESVNVKIVKYGLDSANY